MHTHLKHARPSGFVGLGRGSREQKAQPLPQRYLAMLMALLDFFFGCHHVHLSRVFTIEGESYKVCCDCGAKFAYSLDTMSIERRLPLSPVLTRFRVA